jgi:hypothetical protein
MPYLKFIQRSKHRPAYVNLIFTLALVLLSATFASAAPSSISASGVTSPSGPLWLPGGLGGHLWVADHALGFCRLDPTAPGPPPPGNQFRDL